VFYGENEADISRDGGQTAELSLTVSGLKPDTSYYFAVRAGNENGWSSLSPSVKAKTGKIYTVTVNSSEHGTVTTSVTSAGEGTTVTLTVSPDSGYQLKSLTVKGSANEDVAVDGTGTSRTFTMPASNVTVIVEFEAARYSITINQVSHGSITAEENAAEGTIVTLTVSPESGYQLKSLTVKDAAGADVTVIGTGTSRTFTMPASNVTVSVEFGTGLSVTVNSASYGNITASPEIAGTGTAITLTISPESGYELKSITVKDAAGADVTVNGTGTSRTFIMPASNVTVSAEFGELSEYGLFVQDGTLIYSIPDVSSPFSIAKALYWLAANAQDDTDYTIVINANESLGPTRLDSANLNGKTGIKITLKGLDSERSVQLSSKGSLFTVESGFTLNLGENITLKGTSSNNASLVRINSGAVLTLVQGAKISGNTNSNTIAIPSSGGGVYISDGTFTMNGGEVSGNTSSIGSGGGVFLFGGTFTMRGGKISGNTSSIGSGGGVDVYISGSAFTMSGGEISGNSSHSNGGGVNVSSNTVFTMTGGKISDNITSYRGGGVYVFNAIFTMSGGEISGNTATAGDSAMTYGGGVGFEGTFTKKPVSGSSTSGIIYGYTLGDAKSNKVINNSGIVVNGRGHAVAGFNATLKRETTAGSTQILDSAVSGSIGGWQ
jgi:hypothetical protein